MLDGSRHNAPRYDDESNDQPRATATQSSLPPKPDPETDPGGALRYELMYCVPPQARMAEADIERHVAKFLAELESGERTIDGTQRNR